MRRLILALALLALGSPAFGATLAQKVGATASPQYAGSLYDPFTGAAGSINGRVKNGLIWTINPGSVANTTALQIDASGIGLKGSVGSSPNSVYGYVTAPNTNCRWVQRRLMSSATTAPTEIADYVSGGSGVNVWSKVSVGGGTTNLDQFTSLTAGYLLNGAGAAGNTGSLAALINFLFEAGDIIEERYCLSGGNVLLDQYFDGQLVATGANVTATGISLATATDGFRGDVPATKKYDLFVEADPNAQALIRNGLNTHLWPTDMAGNVHLRLVGTYTKTAPRAVTYTLYDASSDAAVSGYSGLKVTGLTASGNAWAGYVDIPAASMPAKGYIRECRPDVLAPGEACDTTPIASAGPLLCPYGQSLEQQAWVATGGPDPGLSGYNVWYEDASVGVVGNSANTTELNERVGRPDKVSTHLTALIAMGRTWLKNAVAAGLTTPLQTNLFYLRSGVGGLDAYQRSPGTVPFSSFMNGLDRAGGYCTAGMDVSGQYDLFDASPGDIAHFESNLATTYQAAFSHIGRGWPVLLAPMNAVKTANAANSQTIRRIEYNATQDYPSIFKGLGPNTAHLARLGDNYHETSKAYSIELQMFSNAYYDILLGGTTYKRGLFLTSATHTDSSHVAVTFYAPNATATQQYGTAMATYGFDAGLRFGTSGGTFVIGTLHATAYSCAAPSGGNVVCTFTFSGTPFASENALVGGPYGQDPFNPSDNATVYSSGSTNGDYLNSSNAMVVAVYEKANIVATMAGTAALTVNALNSGAMATDLICDNPSAGIYGLYIVSGSASAWVADKTATFASQTLSCGEPKQPVQFYFNPAGATDGSQDYVSG